MVQSYLGECCRLYQPIDYHDHGFLGWRISCQSFSRGHGLKTGKCAACKDSLLTTAHYSPTITGTCAHFTGRAQSSPPPPHPPPHLSTSALSAPNGSNILHTLSGSGSRPHLLMINLTLTVAMQIATTIHHSNNINIQGRDLGQVAWKKQCVHTIYIAASFMKPGMANVKLPHLIQQTMDCKVEDGRCVTF